MAKYKLYQPNPDNTAPALIEKGLVWANVYYMIGYCPQVIPAFNKMVAEMRETFPEIDEDHVSFGRVYKSPYCQGFTIACWNGLIEPGKLPDDWIDPKTSILSEFWW